MFDELISTGADGAKFLKRQIAARSGVKRFAFTADLKNGFDIRAEAARPQTAPHTSVARLDIRATPDSTFDNVYTVKFLHTSGAFEGKGLEDASLKAIIGAAKKSEADALAVEGVDFDDAGFWASRGVVTFHEPVNFYEKVGTALHRCKAILKKEEYDRISRINEIGMTHPYLGMRLIAQLDTRVGENYFNQAPLYEEMQGQKLVLILGEAGARKILNPHLGPIPEFPSYRNDAILRNIAEKLDKRHIFS